MNSNAFDAITRHAGAVSRSGINGGWALEITAEVDVQVEKQVRIKDKRHKKKDKKRH